MQSGEVSSLLMPYINQTNPQYSSEKKNVSMHILYLFINETKHNKNEDKCKFRIGLKNI